ARPGAPARPRPPGRRPGDADRRHHGAPVLHPAHGPAARHHAAAGHVHELRAALPRPGGSRRGPATDRRHQGIGPRDRVAAAEPGRTPLTTSPERECTPMDTDAATALARAWD